MCEILPTYIERDRPGSLLIVPRAPLGLPDMAYAAMLRTVRCALKSTADADHRTSQITTRDDFKSLRFRGHFETVFDPNLLELDRLDSR